MEVDLPRVFPPRIRGCFPPWVSNLYFLWGIWPRRTRHQLPLCVRLHRDRVDDDLLLHRPYARLEGDVRKN